MVTAYKRVHVPRFCERCGKEEFEGWVFGEYRTRHLRADSPEMGMVCDHCKPTLSSVVPKLSSFFSEPIVFEDLEG